MPEEVFGFSRNDAGRLSKTNRTVEDMVEHVTRRRGRYPIVTGGAGLRLYYITEDDGSGNPIPVFRGSHVTVELTPLSGDDPVEARTRLMKGVAFTGQIVSARRVKIGDTTYLQIISPGEVQWASVAVDDITSIGTCAIAYWDDQNEENATCEVEARLFNASSPVSAEDECYVMFRQDILSAELPDSPAGTPDKFVVIPRNCPDFLEEV